MVARRAHNPEVVGSSPSSATKKRTLTFMVGVHFSFAKYGLIIQRPTGSRSEVARAPGGRYSEQNEAQRSNNTPRSK